MMIKPVLFKNSTIVFLFFTCLFLAQSCSKDSDAPNLPEKTDGGTEKEVETYTFLRKEIIAFKAYRGSEHGGIEISNTEKPESFWNPTKLSDYFYHTLTVSRDSILERPFEYEINDFRYELRKDSVYRWNRYANFWEFYGVKRNDTLEHYVCFYSFQKHTPPSLAGENGHNSGEVKYTRYFNNNPYLFKGPEEMKSKNDEVAWYNIKYIFVKKK